MFPIQLRTDESTTAIGDVLQLSAEIGVEGVVLFGGILVLYVIIEAIMTTVLKLETPYPIFTFDADPVLLLTGTIIGIFTVQGAGSLLLYHFYVGIKSESIPSVVLSFIALGIGGALLEITLLDTLGVLISLI